MTRIAGFLAATLAAALAGGLCLLIGVVIGRDSRTPAYPDTYPPEGDDGIQPPDLWPPLQSGTIALPRVSTCGACLKRYTLAYQSQMCPHPFRVVA